MTNYPAEVVTLLFCDMGGGVSSWDLPAHSTDEVTDRLEVGIRQSVSKYGGEIIGSPGDRIKAVFGNALAAVSAAIGIQHALSSKDPSTKEQDRPRMALYLGIVRSHQGEYMGLPFQRVAHLLEAAHAGQILISNNVAARVANHLPPGHSLQNLGLHRLSDLMGPEQIYQLTGPDLPSDFPCLQTLENRPNNLPIQPTLLFGREREIQQACELLVRKKVRLLTLTGPGGIGKTRLGLQIAANLLNYFREGVFFISLAELEDPGMLASRIVGSLGLQESGEGEPQTMLQEYLLGKHLLLLLDNFEHIQSAAPMVAELLENCAGLSVLATSREAMHLRGEQEYPVSALALPEPQPEFSLDQALQSPAIQLFMDRAIAVKPNFAINDQESVSALMDICIWLDGLPLAIELAAARVKLFAIPALLNRLRGTDRGKSTSVLHILSHSAGDHPVRHQTIRNTVRWSYDLLDDAEKSLFRRLSVFSGGCTIEAAEAVFATCGRESPDILILLSSLVDKSLLRVEEQPDGNPRFIMLTVIQEYAREMLENREEENARNCHADNFLSLVEQAEPELRGANQANWFANLEREHDNLRAALGWSISKQRTETGLRLVSSLLWFWIRHGHLSEGRSWTEQVLSLPEIEAAPVKLRANALNGAATLIKYQGDIATSRSYCEQCLEISRRAEDWPLVARSMGDLGALMLFQGEIQSGEALLKECIVLSRELGEKSSQAESMAHLAVIAMDQKDYPLAFKLLEESLALWRDQGDLSGIAENLTTLGLLELDQENYSNALQIFEEEFRICQELGDVQGVSIALSNIGLVLFEQGNLIAARTRLEQSLRGFREIGDQLGIACVLEVQAAIAVKREDPQRACNLLGVAEMLRDRLGVPVPPGDLPFYNRMLGEIKSKMKPGEIEKAWVAGRRMLAEGLGTVIEFALMPEPIPAKPSSHRYPAGLTPREVDILRLVAQGLSDIQVAERLVISPRTVNAHLTSIYGKLGVNSRSAATRFAVDNDLA